MVSHSCPQTFPVVASSLCLLMLSLDRYATVKHPRFTQLRQRQYLPSVLAFVSWFGASVLCIPFLLVYKVTSISPSPPTAIPTPNGLQLNPTTMSPFRDDSLINDRKLCVSDYGSDDWHLVFIVTYVSFAFIVPCCGVIFNHLGELVLLRSNEWSLIERPARCSEEIVRFVSDCARTTRRAAVTHADDT